jgi:hypothetical protein
MAFSSTAVQASATPFFPNALTTHVTAQSVSATSNDVAGVVTLVTDATGLATNILAATIGFQYPLPAGSAVQLTPRNSVTALAGGAAAAGWSAIINASGQLEIRTGVATVAGVTTYVFSYAIVAP